MIRGCAILSLDGKMTALGRNREVQTESPALPPGFPNFTDANLLGRVELRHALQLIFRGVREHRVIGPELLRLVAGCR
jgi:hypothetical protein